MCTAAFVKQLLPCTVACGNVHCMWQCALHARLGWHVACGMWHVACGNVHCMQGSGGMPLLSVPHATCPVPHALCHMPCATCPVPVRRMLHLSCTGICLLGATESAQGLLVRSATCQERHMPGAPVGAFCAARRAALVWFSSMVSTASLSRALPWERPPPSGSPPPSGWACSCQLCECPWPICPRHLGLRPVLCCPPLVLPLCSLCTA